MVTHYSIFFKHLENKVSLTTAEKEVIKTLFVNTQLEKKQILLTEGHMCKYMAFVVTGILRAYSTDEKGNEHISQFSSEGWWTSDMNSFFTGENSRYSIDAIEKSEVLLITNTNFESLMIQVPVMERYFRLLFQNSLITKEKRLVSSHTHTAIEKYSHMVKYYPELVNRVPQHFLASYLGLSPETVSRLKGRFM